jgi:hypothetical protein
MEPHQEKGSHDLLGKLHRGYHAAHHEGFGGPAGQDDLDSHEVCPQSAQQ